ncbi:type I glutamate--ammonia ligase [candidate division LCP-89 bacterium B3_LCP]|uniref:Type I glutamate--ammonia ligase n=1 Tax=candidate division LCP-89 bacterium B3_LCP TaxID=2012998 RepID=A0A532V3W6_UNCL8|nr:MAG: type I glutamate--ammonia ligase [candidate division LCP-89 bacterium B3_LCP]
MKTIEDIERFIAERSVVMVDLKFSNLFGGWHHISLPASHATAQVLEKGIGFDSSSTPGYKSVEAGDMVLMPDPETAFLDPFWEVPTLSFLCNICEADTKEQFHRDPRVIARRAEDYLISTGIADRSLWGPEFEFYVFDSVMYRDEANSSAYRLEAGESFWNSHDDLDPGLGHAVPRGGAYHVIPPQDRYYNLRGEITQLLEAAGVEVHYHHHEAGCPSQQEIEVVLGSLTRMSDVTQMIKYFIKNTAKKHGQTATFMPKPMHQQAGSGMHFHQHLFKGDEPLFYDAKGYGGLSDLALSYLAGILLHGPALMALTNPSTNSFKRLVPGYEAPVNLFFSLANRSAAIRIPKYTQAPPDKRIEFRPPDGTCNPYLAMSAMLLAGIDGIKKNLNPTDLGFGPYDQNLFAPENTELRRSIKNLPASLDEALVALEEDHDFLLEGDVFLEDVITTWVEFKMKQEYLEVRNRPHPYEIALYYNC